MNRKKARAVLRRYRGIDGEIQRAEERVKEFLEYLNSVASIPSPSQKWDGMPHSGRLSQSTEEVALRRAQLLTGRNLERYQELNGRVLGLMELKQKVEDAFLLCKPDEVEVVRRHWLAFMPMSEVAEEMNLAIATAWRYEYKVIDEICEVFGFERQID